MSKKTESSSPSRSPYVNAALGLLIGAGLFCTLIAYQLLVRASGWGQFGVSVVVAGAGYFVFRSLRVTGGLMVMIVPLNGLFAVEVLTNVQKYKDLPRYEELTYEGIGQRWPFSIAYSTAIDARADQRGSHGERQAAASDGTSRIRSHVAFPLYPKEHDGVAPVHIWGACVGTGGASCYEPFERSTTEIDRVYLLYDVDLEWHREDVLRAVRRAASDHSVPLPDDESSIVLVEPRLSAGDAWFWRGLGGFSILHGVFFFVWVCYFVGAARKAQKQADK